MGDITAKEPNNKYPLIWVEWYDTKTEDAWHDIDSARKSHPALCGTVGQLIKMDDKEIIIVSTVGLDDQDDEVCQRMNIQTSAITNFIVLRNRNGRK